jgi:large subunit ribosomal protein L30
MVKQSQGKMLKITLIRSVIGVQPKHKTCVKTLGLRRIRHTITIADHPCVRGIIKKIGFLLSVKEVSSCS